jgi:hypothetical protein
VTGVPVLVVFNVFILWGFVQRLFDDFDNPGYFLARSNVRPLFCRFLRLLGQLS